MLELYLYHSYGSWCEWALRQGFDFPVLYLSPNVCNDCGLCVEVYYAVPCARSVFQAMFIVHVHVLFWTKFLVFHVFGLLPL